MLCPQLALLFLAMALPTRAAPHNPIAVSDQPGTEHRARSARPAANRTAGSEEASCRSFVQGFYDSYLKFANQEHAGASSDLIVKRRPALFSEELRRRLAEDSAAAAKSKDEIVGLDFDPFLNAQDFAERYVVRKVSRQGSHYLVELQTITQGKRSRETAVTPELVRSGRGWRFVNFRYPAADAHSKKSDLLGVLQELRESRRKHVR